MKHPESAASSEAPKATYNFYKFMEIRISTNFYKFMEIRNASSRLMFSTIFHRIDFFVLHIWALGIDGKSGTPQAGSCFSMIFCTFGGG